MAQEVRTQSPDGSEAKVAGPEQKAGRLADAIPESPASSKAVINEDHGDGDDDDDDDDDDDFDPEAKDSEAGGSSSEDESEHENKYQVPAEEPEIQIKTRRQQQRDTQNEKKGHALTPMNEGRAAELWAELNNTPGTGKPEPSEQKAAPQVEMITIERTFEFAGKVTTEQKLVPKDSAEGRAYAAEKKASASQPPGGSQGLRRPKKRVSQLEANAAAAKSQKLNTLEKSRLDWLGFVDREGIHEDLRRKNKDGYLERQDFLGRVDARREEELRQARQK